VASGAVRLGGVLDDRDTVPDHRADRLDRRHLAVQVHGDHRAGAAGDVARDVVDVDEGVLVAVHQHRLRPAADHRLGGGDERVRRQDHLIAGSDLEAAQRQLDRVSPVAHAHGVRHAAVGGEAVLEVAHGGGQDEGRIVRDGRDGRHD
jgi:hypothetical protein